MKICKLPNGDLQMSAGDDLTRRAIARMREPQSADAEARFVKRFLRCYGYRTIKPEECGALTSATLITDGKDVWGDMTYEWRSFLEALGNGNVVVWKKG